MRDLRNDLRSMKAAVLDEDLVGLPPRRDESTSVPFSNTA
jgi:hypothetical protein